MVIKLDLQLDLPKNAAAFHSVRTTKTTRAQHLSQGPGPCALWPWEGSAYPPLHQCGPRPTDTMPNCPPKQCFCLDVMLCQSLLREATGEGEVTEWVAQFNGLGASKYWSGSSLLMKTYLRTNRSYIVLRVDIYPWICIGLWWSLRRSLYVHACPGDWWVSTVDPWWQVKPWHTGGFCMPKWALTIIVSQKKSKNQGDSYGCNYQSTTNLHLWTLTSNDDTGIHHRETKTWKLSAKSWELINDFSPGFLKSKKSCIYIGWW